MNITYDELSEEAKQDLQMAKNLENYQEKLRKYTDEIKARISPNLNIPTEIDYKYNEGQTLQEIAEYVNKTYGEHYSQNKFQATEFIIDSGHGEGFCLGNMLKYTQRYGKKNDPAEWRKDLMKVIHYTIIMLHVHDLQHKKD
jgi:hypothetical protein